MYAVYILKCADGTLYVGSTSDFERRLYQHNHAKAGAHYTKIRRPVTLVYRQNVRTLATARKREAELKRLTRGQKLQLIVKEKGLGTVRRQVGKRARSGPLRPSL